MRMQPLHAKDIRRPFESTYMVSCQNKRLEVSLETREWKPKIGRYIYGMIRIETGPDPVSLTMRGT